MTTQTAARDTRFQVTCKDTMPIRQCPSVAAAKDINFGLEVSVNIMRLRFDPVMGRRTFYGKITIGRKTFWLQRWDTERCSRSSPFAFSADRLMCWTAGSRKS